MEFAVSRFDSALDRVPVRLSVTWLELCRALTTFRVYDVEDKRQLPAWSPTAYPEGAYRSAAQVEHVSMLVLDYDAGVTIDEAREAWGDWPHILHTSWSHTDGAPKFRVVLPLEEPVPGPAWRHAWEWARLFRSAGAASDPKCCDPSRLYFRPAIRARDWPHEAYVHDPDGPLLRLDYEALARRRLEAEARDREARTRRVVAEVGARSVDRVLRETLAVDPEARERAAHQLRARIVGLFPNVMARGIGCPQCGRPDVWFPLDPREMRGAACNHRESCGWHGSLVELLTYHIGRVAA